MKSLMEVFISKANAKQRRGRAGRIQKGFCFRMYTAEKYQKMADFMLPEILRVPLEELCLIIMVCELKWILTSNTKFQDLLERSDRSKICCTFQPQNASLSVFHH